jgi:hypothetical protein
MNMSYEEGYKLITQLVKQLPADERKTFMIADLCITYSRYNKYGDYKFSLNGHAPRHTDIINEIFTFTTDDNFNIVVDFLNEVYQHGSKAVLNIIKPSCKHKIFWTTLLEEIKYPQPKFKRRKLSFQRFYEAALVHKGIITLNEVKHRINTHGKSIPPLLQLKNLPIPLFYT